MFIRRLLIFVRNPFPGKVKTRLASQIGEEKALRVYHILLQHTFTIAAASGAEVHVFFTDHIDTGLPGYDATFQGHLQEGDDLGQRLSMAAAQLSGDDISLILIGSDCYQMTANHFTEAFKVLDRKQAVLGTAFDGGYYLLGMRGYYPELFEGIPWSSSRVADKTVDRMNSLDLDYLILPPLYDVDDLDSLLNSGLSVPD